MFQMQRSRKLSKVGIGLIIGLMALSVFGQTQNSDTRQLLPNQTVERELKGGEVHAYRITLAAGQYLKAVTEQRGIDVVVTLIAADGKKLLEVDSPNGTQGPEPLSLVAEASGTYRLEVRSLEKEASAGRYEVKVLEVRSATPQDKPRIAAERAYAEGELLFNQATADSLRGAIAKYEEALPLWRGLKEYDKEAETLLSIGATYSRLSEMRKALGYLNQALVLFRYLGDRSGEASTLHDIGSVYDKMDEKQKALDYYNQALPLRRAVGDRRGEANTLNNMGDVYSDLGEMRKALEYFNQALPLIRDVGNRFGEAAVLQNIAHVYRVLGEKRKALDYLNQALTLDRAVGNRKGEAFTLNNIGFVYLDLGEMQKALDYINQALAIFRALGDRREEAVSLSVIGRIYVDLGENRKALDHYNQSVTLSRAAGNRRAEASTLNNIGLIYASLGENRKALDYYNQALPLSRAVGDRNDEAATLHDIGVAYHDLGEKQKALEYFQNSLLLSKAVGNKSHEAITLDALQSYWNSRNNRALAIVFGKQSVNVYQQLRSNIKGLDKSVQQTYLKSVEPTYRKLADILINEGRFPEAQAVLDLLKEEEFKQIARRSGEPLFTLPYSRAEEEAIKIVDRLASLGRELSELKAKPKDSLTAEDTKRLSEIESIAIPAANKALRQATEALSTVAPDVKNALDLKMKDNIQNILPALGKGVVALYTVVGKASADENAKDKTNDNKVNIGWILLVTPEFRKAYPIDTQDLEQTVFKFREALRSPTYDPQPLAQELYRKLFLQTSSKQKTALATDLETYLGKQKDKTLMWSLDGILRYVPMAALHDGKNYLVEKYRNVVFNTASLGSLKDSTKPNWEVVGLGVSTEETVKGFDGRTLRFSALKGSETELNSIVKENNGKDAEGIFPGTLKINREFTKEALFDGARTGKPVIHVSSHFWFNPAREETSFLLLGNGGRLEVTEFQDYPNLFSAVDFLSLSACDTATGGNANNSSAAVTGKAETEEKAREANGKEIEGFAYVAQTLGAKSVMASLWQVSDEGTKELMLKFYQIKKEQPELPKGEALRQAQLSLLGAETKIARTSGANRAEPVNSGGKKIELPLYQKDEKKPFAHPHYWSPFVLIGNWR